MDARAAVENIRKTQGALQILAALQLTGYLWPQSTVVQDGARFDFIVVGAGSAGNVVANRLSEVEGISVLLIEAGGDPPLESVVPSLSVYLKNTSVDWRYTSVKDGSVNNLENEVVDVTRGKMLGGSSSINFMAYTRGNSHDYDTWARIVNDSTWNWKNVLPYFIKSEKLDKKDLKCVNKEFHGTTGYLGVSKQHSDATTGFLDALAEIGRNVAYEVNGEEPIGYSEPLLTVAKGFRQSSALAFLSKFQNCSNLHVLKNALVTKILFDDDKNATGVELILNEKIIRLKANKEVIVAGGTINSPQLLMLSGIGPTDHLKDKNIPVISDLPVGQSMEDHVNVLVVHKTAKSKPNKKPTDPSKLTPLVIGYSALNETQNYPDYETMTFILNNKDEMMPYCAFYYNYKDEICQGYYDESDDRQLVHTLVSYLYPKSRGKVLLNTTDPLDQPFIIPNYLSKESEIDNFKDYLKDYLKISNSSYFKCNNAELIVPKACQCSQKRDFWRCYIKCLVVSGYHFSGSCRMGEVVDPRLKVYGVGNLRVVDASVMPRSPGANINAAAMMIGEKAADMIKQDHGLLP